MAECSLADDPGAQAAVIAAAHRELSMLRGLLLDLGAVEQEADLRQTLRSWNVSVRVRWQFINARLQAQMQATGTADLPLLTEGSLLTALVVLFEAECTPRQIDEISNVLADLDHASTVVAAVARAGLVPSRPGELLLEPSRILDALDQPIEAFLRVQQLAEQGVVELEMPGDVAEARDRLRRSSDELNDGLQQIQHEAVALTRLPWASAIDGLTAYGREALKDRAYRVRLTAGATPGGLPGEEWAAPMSAARSVLDQIASCAFEPRDQRVAAGKPAFLSVKLGVEERGEEDLLRIQDDGLPPHGRPSLGHLPATVRVRDGSPGCVYEIVVPKRALPKAGQFVVVRVAGHRIAFPAAAVSSVFGPGEVMAGYVHWGRAHCAIL